MPVPTAAGQILTSTAAGAGNYSWDSAWFSRSHNPNNGNFELAIIYSEGNRHILYYNSDEIGVWDCKNGISLLSIQK